MRLKDIFLFASLFSKMSISLGFAANRTEWDAIPQLNLKMPVEVLMKEVKSTVIDDVHGTSEKKKPLGYETASPIKNPLLERRDLMAQDPFNLRLDPKPLQYWRSKISAARDERKETGPLNVILLLIDGFEQLDQRVRAELEDPKAYPVQGVLQTCSNSGTVDGLRYASPNSGCDCNDLLRYNVVSLLSWAHHIKEMSTSTLYEMPPVYSRGVEIDTRSFMSPQVRRIDRQLRGPWQSSYGRKSKRSESPTAPIEPPSDFQPSKDVARHHQQPSLWRVTDMLARLREAFFRTLLDSLSGVRTDREEEQQQRPDSRQRSHLRRGGFREHAARLLDEIDLLPNDNGFVLVATAAAEQTEDALRLLGPYSSRSNSLLIVTSTCAHDQSKAAFFARGPGSEQLLAPSLRYVFEVPTVVRGVIDRHDCRECDNASEETREPTLMSFDEPVLLFEEPESTRLRVAREEQKKTGEKGKDEKPKEVPESKTMKGNDTDPPVAFSENHPEEMSSQEKNSYSTTLLASTTMFAITYSIRF